VYLWFYSDETADYDLIREALRFSLNPVSPVPKIQTHSAVFDFDSDYADDKPGWISPLSEVGDSEVIWTWGNEKHWSASKDTLDRYSSHARLEPWMFFSRVALTVEVDYEWDFDDEVGMENFTDSIARPIFESIEMDVSGLSATEYLIQPYEL
jgi:hypothetical protein